ncbi:MAG TPA: squalene--hopene cyclase [Candidatus Polarisedimenticolaceae bacterium]|nr:squalene--hopene cyclase [Candidatus Polarisedimenticolaceae bacterium]
MSEATRRLEAPDPARRAGAAAIEAAQRYLLSIQHPDGHWRAELEGDTILESEYVLTLHFLGRGADPRVPKAANEIRRKQLPDGGWAIYPGGPTEISASTKAYFVLKLAGDRPDAPHMQRARRAILEAGGIEACNSFTKIYLSIFGQYSWDRCPAVPPEMILLPRWFYINIYEMSSWSRGIVVPLAIIRAHKPRCAVPAWANISELVSPRPPAAKRDLWVTLFSGLDRMLKMHERLPVKPLRKRALEASVDWMLERLEGSDGIGAIFPPIINTIIALRCLGYAEDHPLVQGQLRELEKLEIEEGDALRVQPCFSPVWDTALTVNALAESGFPADHPALLHAARWLLDKRGHEQGDWRVKVGAGPRPGWFFEYANPYYPDNDSTAQVITALSKLRFADREEDWRRRVAIREGHEWHLTMQNRDGGWAAFDKGCDKEILTYVPFADHNAMIDPSTADITARTLETLHCLGYDRNSPLTRRAIEFLLREQEPDGSWFGRWGCNYIYGTWLGIWGLRVIGEDVSADWCRRAADWLRQCQNPDGGWGELPQSYDDPSQKGKGPSTPSQTAWALMGLWAAGETDGPRVRCGLDYLLRTQRPDGSWKDEHWTGTGFPSVFYLRYHLYATYFPLLALATFFPEQGGGDALSRTA